VKDAADRCGGGVPQGKSYFVGQLETGVMRKEDDEVGEMG
jgi:hypothetical protein